MTAKASSEILFPNPQRRGGIDERLGAKLTAALARMLRGGPLPTLDVEAFRAELAAYRFDEPRDLEATLDWTIDTLACGLVQPAHPGYLGLFVPAPALPAECADRIAAAFNPQVCVWSHAPAAVDIEAHVIRQVAARAGMPVSSFGHFTSGGAEANATACVCALTAAAPDFANAGARAFAGPPRVYVSAESHLAWLKIAHQTGIGRDAVQLVATDGAGRMGAAKLADAVRRDAAQGCVPVMIGATAGTTNAGMVDPLHDCADVARANGMWFHIDAAWGGALIASERERHVLSGIERADSVTIDAHKWFATTMGAGMFVTTRPEVLSAAFRVSASYMPSHDPASDLYLASMQWSRRFIGLRLFLALASVGWRGYGAHVERAIDLIRDFAAAMQARGWRVANGADTAVACLVPPQGAHAVSRCVERVLDGGAYWISEARFEGSPVVRVCVSNGRTTKAHLDGLAGALAEMP